MDPITPLSVYRDHYGPGTPGSGRLDNYRYVPIKLGWIKSQEMRRPGHINDKPGPSYTRIEEDNEIPDPVDYQIKHIGSIKNYCVYLNGSFIAQAPGNKSKAQKDKFCRAVLWGLMNDPEALKDKLSEIKADPLPEEGPINLIIPDPLPVPMYPVNEYRAPAPLLMGPLSYFGWHKYGSCMIKEEGILSCS